MPFTLYQCSTGVRDEAEMKLSDGEKLILVMLADICKHLRIKGAVDPVLVHEAMYGGHAWGLRMEYPDILGATETEPSIVRETIDILDMWRHIEADWAKLSKSDRKLVAAEVERIGRKPRFLGFDGNNESDHLSVAHFVIEQLGMFESLKGRDLNCHAPSLNDHQRMLRVFERVRRTSTGPTEPMSASQLTEVLKGAD